MGKFDFHDVFTLLARAVVVLLLILRSRKFETYKSGFYPYGAREIPHEQRLFDTLF
jgi:hypothetical protein